MDSDLVASPMERTRSWVLIGFVVLALTFAAFLDQVFSGFLHPAWYAAYAVLWIMVLWPLAGPQSSRRNGVILLAFAAVLFGLYLAPTKRELFLNDFRHIVPGMTRTEVEGIMAAYAGNTISQTPTATVYRHSTTGSLSADHGVVHYEGDRVVSTAFLPD